jgi:glycosyltransferase involved in cell wall biosynthesis
MSAKGCSSERVETKPVRVLHMIDSLDMGGAERVAVNLVNHLPRERFEAHLCTTRRDGPLAPLVRPDVTWCRLGRQHSLDFAAALRLRAFIRERGIRIVHAHSTSVFLGAAALWGTRRCALVWHDHFGRYAVEERPASLYRLAIRRADGVIAVNEPLAEWSRRALGMRADRVWYLPNFSCGCEPGGQEPALPGKRGSRIVCVACLRAEKDHLTLLRAMALVVQRAPEAHLLLVGGTHDSSYREQVQAEIGRSGLESSVSWLGERQDVAAILRACDLAVLSSVSEGLPLALIEYGMAGLATIATEAGQCAEVLDRGRAGIVVRPRAPQQLAEAVVSLLEAPKRRAELGSRLRERVREFYSSGPVLQQICRVYDLLLNSNENY